MKRNNLLITMMMVAVGVFGLSNMLMAFDEGVLEQSLYKVPSVHGTDNYDTMRGYGYIQGKNCPRDLMFIYARAWGLDSYYHADDNSYPQDDEIWWGEYGINDHGWSDYTVKLLGFRSIANNTYTNQMTPQEKNLLKAFCDGINDALFDLKNDAVSSDWYEYYLEPYEDHFQYGVQPQHVIAHYLYAFIYPVYVASVYGNLPESVEFGPSDDGDNFWFDNEDYFMLESQMWSFVDNSGIPWMQIDTQIGYTTPPTYRPFVCELTTDTIPGEEVGINAFGWHGLGLPYFMSGVRYPREGLPPISWGFTAHYQDIVDLYEIDCTQVQSGRLMYKIEEGSWTSLRQRDPIRIEYRDHAALTIREVFDTAHHGPIVTFKWEDNEITKAYASRGVWDINDKIGNMIHHGMGFFQSESIQDIVATMNDCKCFPAGNYMFANGDPQTEEETMKYILGGPLPDRSDCYNYNTMYSDWTYWDGVIYGSVYQGSDLDDIFDSLYEMADLPQDHYQTGRQNPVEYFVNCNSSINHNNPNSEALDIDDFPAYLVYGDFATYRQPRAQEIITSQSFYDNNNDSAWLLDEFLMDKRHNVALEVIPDLNTAADYYKDLLPPEDQTKVTYAFTELNQWISEDDAEATKACTEMLLFKLWQSYFIIETCNPDEPSTWKPYFYVPEFRKHIYDPENPDPVLCVAALTNLAQAYDEWDDDPNQQWGSHYYIAREVGEGQAWLHFPTDSDVNLLRNNAPLSTEWFRKIRDLVYGGEDAIEVGAGQTAPILVKLLPDSVELFYSRAGDSCLDYTMSWIFDDYCPSTTNWAIGESTNFASMVK